MTIAPVLQRALFEDRDGVAVPRLPALLTAAAALFGIAVLWNPVAPACMAGIGALLTVAAARENRFLLGTALVAFGVRALLAVGLHTVAALDLPGMQPLHVGPVAGYRFWIFAPDATGYHGNAAWVVGAWRYGTEFPTPPGTVGHEYFVPIAALYTLLGINPLNAVFFNALFGALAAVTGYRIAERLGGPVAARPAMILITLWPSAVLWSSQLLKDALLMWITLVLLYLPMRAVEPIKTPARWRAGVRWVGLLVMIFVAAAVMHRFRHFMMQLVIPLTAIFAVHALVRPTRQTPWRVFATAAVVLVMFLGVAANRRVDLHTMVVPRYPEIGHVNLGVMYQARGDLDAAEAHYRRALELAKEYTPALKALGTIALLRGDGARAITYFERSLAREPGDEQVRVMLDVLRPPPAAARGQAGLDPGPSPDVDGQVRAALDLLRLPPEPTEAREGRRPSAADAAARKETFEQLNSLPGLVPTPLSVPAEPFAITGPRSDYAAGTRGWSANIVAAINERRSGYSISGGSSLIDPEVRFHDSWDVLRYVPRAFANVLLSPYPWQWLATGGGTGPFKALSAVEVLLLYALIVPLVAGCVMAVRSGSPDALYLVGFVFAVAALFGLVLSNLGILFRLRLASLFPLFIVAGAGWALLLERRRRRA